jgi:hypothetical protein
MWGVNLSFSSQLALSDSKLENLSSLRAQQLLFRNNRWWLIAQSNDRELEMPLSSVASVVVS